MSAPGSAEGGAVAPRGAATLPVAAALGYALLWATTGLFVKGVTGVPALGIAWGRFAVAALLSVALLPIGRGGAGPAHRTPADAARPATGTRRLARTLARGALMTAYYVLATIGFLVGPIGLTALVIALSPAVTILWRFVLTRHVPAHQLIGFLVAAAGVVAYVAATSVQPASGFSRAAILVATIASAGAAVVRAAYSIVLRHDAEHGARTAPAAVNLATFAIGAVVLAPCAFVLVPAGALSGSNLGAVLLLGTVATIVPNALNTYAAQRLDATLNNVIGMVTAPASAVLGGVFLAEPLSWWTVAAMALTLVGVWVCNRAPRPATGRSPAPGRAAPGAPASEGTGDRG